MAKGAHGGGAEGAPPHKKARTLPQLSEPADRDKNVFIPLQGYDAKIDNLFGDGMVVFIRAGVATGKTTLAMHLASQYPGKYVKVPFVGQGEELQWKDSTIKAVKQASGQQAENFEKALMLAAERGETLIYDEAHTLFSSSSVCSALFKADKEVRPKVLLFSASGEAAVFGGGGVTPAEIAQKFMWTPPMPDASELEGPLKEANVTLDNEAIAFFLRFCGGHRGIFMASMRWVQREQARDRNGSTWNLGNTVAKVRASYSNGSWRLGSILGALAASRAIRINGEFESLENIPRAFLELLCGGPRPVDTEWRRRLAVCGFILPEFGPSEEEFQSLDWSNADVTYKVANPLLATYYRHQLTAKRGLQCVVDPMEPDSCIDLLMRALPYLIFAKVTGFTHTVQESPLSQGELPYEDQYNSAITSALQDLGYEADTVRTPELGKVDCFVRLGEKLFVMEGVMAARAQSEHGKHRARFDSYASYREATHKALCTIGSEKDVRSRVRLTKAQGVEIIGLVPDTSHSAYTIHLKTKDGVIISPFSVDCDLVARCFKLKDGNDYEVRSAQTLQHVNASHAASGGAGASGSSAAPGQTVRIRVVYRGTVVGVAFRPNSNPAAIEKAIRDMLDLPADARVRLLDSQGFGVSIDGTLPGGEYSFPG